MTRLLKKKFYTSHTQFLLIYYLDNPLLFILVLTGNNLASNTSQLNVGVTSTLEKVFQSKPFNFQGTFLNQAEIELALNEYESTQIVLFPEAGFSDIKINISSLTHETQRLWTESP